MQENQLFLPVGCHFNPTDSQLVGYYLYNKIANIPIPYQNYLIHQCDLYGSQEPWEIWNSFGGSFTEGCQDLYFFTPLKKKSVRGSRICRKVGTGTWQGEDSGAPIIDIVSKRKIGLKKRFRYENKESDEDGGWIMHEYSLDSSLLRADQVNGYVLCRIRRNQICLKKKRRRVNSEAQLLVPALTMETQSFHSTRVEEGSEGQPMVFPCSTMVQQPIQQTKIYHTQEPESQVPQKLDSPTDEGVSMQSALMTDDDFLDVDELFCDSEEENSSWLDKLLADTENSTIKTAEICL